jgi:hypothetical protein
MTIFSLRVTKKSLRFGFSLDTYYINIIPTKVTCYAAGILYQTQITITPWLWSAKFVPTFADRGCQVVSVADPYGRNLRFFDRSRYFFFQVDPQLYSRGWADPVADPPLLRKSGSAGKRTRTSGSVARNSDHYTTEAVYYLLHDKYKFSSNLTGNTIHLRCVTRNSDH